MLTLNGATVLRATVREPRLGIWTCDLVTASATELVRGDAAVLSADGETWTGQVLRGSSTGGRGFLRLVGGAVVGERTVRAKPYQRAPVSLVAREISTAAGLTLSGAVSTALLARELPAWSRCSGAAMEAWATLMLTLGTSWRIERSGALWFGDEAWPELELVARIVGSSPATRTLDVASDAPLLRPGVTWSGLQLFAVTHRWDGPYRAQVTHG